jgi:hypothetical protein
MVKKYKNHSLKVDAWIRVVTPGLTTPALIDLFEKATTRLWSRGCLTVSDVTLHALADRALFNSAQAYPVLLALKLDHTGIQWGEFRKLGAKLNRDDVIRSVSYFITEFIAIASSITDDILSAPLHDALVSVDVT